MNNDNDLNLHLHDQIVRLAPLLRVSIMFMIHFTYTYTTIHTARNATGLMQVVNKLWQVCWLHQVAASLWKLDLSQLDICRPLLKQLASSLWIKSLDNQVAADLLSSSRSKRCERILISAWWQQLGMYRLSYERRGDISFIAQETISYFVTSERSERGTKYDIVTRAIKLILTSLECDNLFTTYLCLYLGQKSDYIFKLFILWAHFGMNAKLLFKIR